MPRCLGGMENCVHISKVSGIVEGSNPPIGQMAAAGPASEVDLKVANLVVPLSPTVPACSWASAVCPTPLAA